MGLFQALRKLFGAGAAPDFGALIAQGAKIVDVRTSGEFAGGHVNGAINIPLDSLAAKLGKFKKDEVIITCCASGMRSRSARALMQARGYTNVYNGGSWRQLNSYKK